MYKRRRILGTYAGVALAAVLLPGVTPVLDSMPWEIILPGAVFLIVNQLIHSYPRAIRSAPPVMLAILAAIGIVQDTLV
jgi:putative membrane protein